MGITAKSARESARDYGIVLAFLALLAILSFSTNTFLTQQNLVNIFDQIAVLGIFACAIALAMISGVFDLSVTAIAALSAIVGIHVMNASGLLPGVLAAVLLGVALGAINGLAVTYGKVHSFIATLASSMVFRGIAIVVTGGQIVAAEDPALGQLSAASPLFNITWASWMFLAVAIVMGLVVWKTVYGRSVYAVGGNPASARLSGISVGKVQTSAFMISGGLSALAGMILASRSFSAQPNMGSGLELTAIAAVVIGGVALTGGVGAIWRAVLGVLLLQLIGNGFNLLGLPSSFQQVVQGALILFAVALDQRIRKQQKT